MRAQLRTLTGIEAALEKISHDARLDELPVGFARLGELSDFLLSQFKNSCVFEKMSVEVFDLVRTERSAFGHFSK